MSRFVSAGTTADPKSSNEEWLRAQAEVEAKTQAKLAEGKQEGGKSLFEHLQARKAAKQEAFEEAQKLKHQFRTLDDDEIEFLDSVMETSRTREAEVRKETLEQLGAFRRQREEAERQALEAEPEELAAVEGESEAWTSSGVAKKRKKGRDIESIKGVKLRKTSSSAKEADDELSAAPDSSSLPAAGDAQQISGYRVRQPKDSEKRSNSVTDAASGKKEVGVKPAAAALGLAAYSSDED